MAIIGIDLGTTNSTAVVYKEGQVEFIPNAFGEYLTPSVVSKDGDSIIVGKIAKERLVHHADKTAALFKREMGNQTIIRLGKDKYTPEKLSAVVVQQLVADAEAYLQEKVEEIVISVPAYFNAKQRLATKKIGDLLGIKVERLINEPSAAAIACRDQEEDETFIVFDFGGGTLDVSVVDCFANVINICAIAGNNQLGGSDFDIAIANTFIQQSKFPAKTINDFVGANRNSLLYEAERVKLALQDQDEVWMRYHFHKRTYELLFTRDMLYTCAKPIFEKLKTVIGTAVKDSGFSAPEFTGVILVGGSSYMPVVQDYLRELLAIPIMTSPDMNLLVAKGLGTYIAIKERKEEVASLVVTDVCPFSLSTAVVSEIDPSVHLADVLIEKNTVLPTSKSLLLSPANLGQKHVNIQVYQGESAYAKYNMLLGTRHVDLPVNFDRPEMFTLTYSYDINSMLFVEVLVHSTQERSIFQVGESDYLEDVTSKQTLEQIKDISLKITRKPEIDLLEARILRVCEQASKQKSKHLIEYWMETEKELKSNGQSLRKQHQIIEQAHRVLDMYEKDNDLDRLDIFSDDDSKGFLS